jgi:hypothetical protein
MYNPAADSLMDTVRKFNEMTRRARAGEPAAEDYLQAVASDPVSEWFTILLREKAEELRTEQARADRLAAVCRRWYADTNRRFSDGRCSAAEVDLVKALRELSIVE